MYDLFWCLSIHIPQLYIDYISSQINKKMFCIIFSILAIHFDKPICNSHSKQPIAYFVNFGEAKFRLFLTIFHFKIQNMYSAIKKCDRYVLTQQIYLTDDIDMNMGHILFCSHRHRTCFIHSIFHKYFHVCFQKLALLFVWQSKNNVQVVSALHHYADKLVEI